MIFRSQQAKEDTVHSWHRPDRVFFAAGACHLLAAAFLETYSAAGYYPIIIRPEEGYRGTHVAVSNGEFVFDYHGYTEEPRYCAHFFKKIGRFFPGWQGTILALNEFPGGESFCRKYLHRLPDQYLFDPRPRALSFLRRFRAPTFE
jgi:hypothetical protein